MTDATDVILAAGAVVWRTTPDGDVEVAIVHRPRYDDWSLPKGKLDPGEHLVEAAVREVREETGQHVVLGRPLGSTSYVAAGRPKRVRYWAAESLGGTFVPHAEIDALEWHPVAAAQDRVHREADRAVLGEFLRGPLRTATVMILRHAKAVPRREWDGDDRARPLQPEGHEQVERLRRVLPAWRLEHIVSSPSARCVDTVGPLLAGRTLETEPGLSEDGYKTDPESALKLLECRICDNRAVLLCSHRPVLPPLIEVVRRFAVIPIDLDLDATPLRTAEMLIAHVADGRVVGGERQRA